MEQLKISRKQSFIDSTIGADCTFLVGANCVDDAEKISGHKLIFANASPVFKTMFFGSVPEEGDSIKVPEIHPETFHAMVNFFYTGEITMDSVEKAIDLWYVADKYNIAELMESVPDFIIAKLTPENVCRILRLSILYRNKIVMKKCEEIITLESSTILKDSSFLEADISTFSFILDMEKLNVSEIDLFRALVRYDNARKDCSGDAKPGKPPSTSPATTGSLGPKKKKARFSDKISINSCGEGSSRSTRSTQKHIEALGANPVKELVKKIRFLSMTPKEFVECLGMSSLISLPESLNIIVNIIDPTVRTHPMPEGYCTKREKRELKSHVYKIQKKSCFCQHVGEVQSLQTIDLRNAKTYAFSLEFQCSARIQIAGVKFKVHSGICKVIIAILNAKYQKLFESGTMEISGTSVDTPRDVFLPDPVHIDPGLYFIIKVILSKANYAKEISFNKHGCSEICTANGVNFEFGRNDSPCRCSGLIHSIIFSTY